ncbi:MAG: hypothetical protein HXX14_21005, partial [Bacteroidetes bacterium]|nr:hypothetical protein [Bacteroidota bacterium]
HVMGLGLSATKRLDLQLIGRTGRQGDPGYSRLYRSLEEELVLKFAGGWGDGLSERLGSGVEWGESITKRLAETVVEECQRKQEGQHYEELKRGIEYDRVLEVQRTTFYRDREQVLEADAGRLKMFVLKLAREEISELGTAWLEGENEVGGQEGTAGLVEATTALFGFKIASELQLFLGSRKEVSEDAIKKWLLAKLEQVMEQAGLGLRKVNLSENIRDTLLKTLDGEWVEYLTPLEELRHGIFLRVYGGQEPLREYQREAWHLWAEFQVKSQKKILENITVFCK